MVTECGVYCTHAGGSAVEHGLVITAVPGAGAGLRLGEAALDEERRELQIEARCTRYQVVGGACTATTEHMCLQASVPASATLTYELARPKIRRVWE